MEFKSCNISGVVICKPKIISDKRGYFMESFRKDLLENFLGHKLNFCQNNISKSSYGTLRGLHFQTNPYSQAKLVSVISGEILDVVLDLRKKSKTYGKYFSIILNEINNYQLFIPKGMAHGFSVLSDFAKVQYQVDNYYNSKNAMGIYALDKNLNIDWNLNNNNITMSEKDSQNPIFEKKKLYNF